jgi:hypothetical protein
MCGRVSGTGSGVRRDGTCVTGYTIHVEGPTDDEIAKALRFAAGEMWPLSPGEWAAYARDDRWKLSIIRKENDTRSDMSKLALGDHVIDRISNFNGVITGICHYITGASRAQVQPLCGENGEYRDSQWFDFDRLDLLDS